MGSRCLLSKLKMPGQGAPVWMNIAGEASVALDQLTWPQRDERPRLQLPSESQAL